MRAGQDRARERVGVKSTVILAKGLSSSPLGRGARGVIKNISNAPYGVEHPLYPPTQGEMIVKSTATLLRGFDLQLQAGLRKLVEGFVS